MFEIGDSLPDTKLGFALDGVDMVIHAAAHVHLLDESSVDPQAEFRRDNVEGPLSLARQTAAVGGRRQ